MFETPRRVSDETIIWRYIGLDKFLDLLLTNTIKFTRASIASDKNEIKWILKSLEKSDEYKYESEDAIKHIETLRDSMYISCWTMKDNESRPLWATYLDNSKQGVAICSTVGKFIDSIEWEDFGFDYRIVDYRNDFDFKELQNNTIAINTKNIAYREESELRFCVSCNESTLPRILEFKSIHKINDSRLRKRSKDKTVVKLDVDLEKLVSGIMISPYSSKWQKDNIIRLIKDYKPELIGRIIDSTINE